MEFKFNLNDVFKQPVVELNNNLIPPGFSGDRRQLWDTVTKVSEVVNAMGEASANAQGLTKPITTAERLRNSEHRLYLLIDPQANNGKGAVTGMLKTGTKGLYVFDKEGQHYQVSPPCVLDFYVHETRQRTGLGKHIFEHMLQKEGTAPVKMAIDRPSEKFLGFLNKHYGLHSPVKQMNNYVVFDGFFPKSSESPIPVESDRSITPSKRDSANGLQNYPSSPYGRYGAPRPPCSMGQIIHNQSSTITKRQEPTGVQSMPATNFGLSQNSPLQSNQVPQSMPNISYQQYGTVNNHNENARQFSPNNMHNITAQNQDIQTGHNLHPLNHTFQQQQNQNQQMCMTQNMPQNMELQQQLAMQTYDNTANATPTPNYEDQQRYSQYNIGANSSQQILQNNNQQYQAEYPLPNVAYTTSNVPAWTTKQPNVTPNHPIAQSQSNLMNQSQFPAAENTPLNNRTRSIWTLQDQNLPVAQNHTTTSYPTASSLQNIPQQKVFYNTAGNNNMAPYQFDTSQHNIQNNASHMQLNSNNNTPMMVQSEIPNNNLQHLPQAMPQPLGTYSQPNQIEQHPFDQNYQNTSSSPVSQTNINQTYLQLNQQAQPNQHGIYNSVERNMRTNLNQQMLNNNIPQSINPENNTIQTREVCNVCNSSSGRILQRNETVQMAPHQNLYTVQPSTDKTHIIAREHFNGDGNAADYTSRKTLDHNVHDSMVPSFVYTQTQTDNRQNTQHQQRFTSDRVFSQNEPPRQHPQIMSSVGQNCQINDNNNLNRQMATNIATDRPIQSVNAYSASNQDATPVANNVVNQGMNPSTINNPQGYESNKEATESHAHAEGDMCNVNKNTIGRSPSQIMHEDLLNYGYPLQLTKSQLFARDKTMIIR